MQVTRLNQWKYVVVAVMLGATMLALSACGAYTFAGTAYNPTIDAPEVTGTQGNGAEFRLSDLRDKVVLLFFGYTNCPDICPMTLGEMKQVQTQLGDKARDVAFVLVSLDPERDTPERLQAYTTAFSPDFIGVHVPVDALEGVNGEAGVKKSFGVFSEKRTLDEANPDDYAIDHTGWTYVIDRDGKLREVLSQDVEIAGIVKDIEYLLR